MRGQAEAPRALLGWSQVFRCQSRALQRGQHSPGARAAPRAHAAANVILMGSSGCSPDSILSASTLSANASARAIASVRLRPYCIAPGISMISGDPPPVFFHFRLDREVHRSASWRLASSAATDRLSNRGYSLRVRYGAGSAHGAQSSGNAFARSTGRPSVQQFPPTHESKRGSARLDARSAEMATISGAKSRFMALAGIAAVGSRIIYPPSADDKDAIHATVRPDPRRFRTSSEQPVDSRSPPSRGQAPRNDMTGVCAVIPAKAGIHDFRQPASRSAPYAVA